MLMYAADISVKVACRQAIAAGIVCCPRGSEPRTRTIFWAAYHTSGSEANRVSHHFGAGLESDSVRCNGRMSSQGNALGVIKVASYLVNGNRRVRCLRSFGPSCM